MKARRAVMALASAAALLALGNVNAIATSTSMHIDSYISEGSGLSFALRPSYDSGGAAPLHLYIGYADANILDPPEQADGQASWYNFNIAETAAFKPADRCLPRNDPDTDDDGTPDAVEDVQEYLTDYITRTLERAQDGHQPPTPLVPSVRGLCSERLPGFAQSRFPSTFTIDEHATDNYFDKPTAASACRDDPDSSQCATYKQYWPTFSSTTRRFVRDGAFSAVAGPAIQRSESLLMGAGDASSVSIGLARNITETKREQGGVVVVESRALLDDICIGAVERGCMLAIDHIEQVARVTAGPEPKRFSQTTIAGVRGVSGDSQITANDLKLEQGTIDLGGYFTIQAVSKTRGCDADDPDAIVADAGGFRIAGSGGAGQPGGAIMVGGACARARWQQVSIPDVPFAGDQGVAGTPDRTLTVPGTPPVAGTDTEPAPGAPRIVTKTILTPRYLRPVAWRTAPYWGTALGLLVVASVLLYVFRGSPVAAPAVRTIDRFARQFIKG